MGLFSFSFCIRIFDGKTAKTWQFWCGKSVKITARPTNPSKSAFHLEDNKFKDETECGWDYGALNMSPGGQNSVSPTKKMICIHCCILYWWSSVWNMFPASFWKQVSLTMLGICMSWLCCNNQAQDLRAFHQRCTSQSHYVLSVDQRWLALGESSYSTSLLTPECRLGEQNS